MHVKQDWPRSRRKGSPHSGCEPWRAAEDSPVNLLEEGAAVTLSFSPDHTLLLQG